MKDGSASEFVGNGAGSGLKFRVVAGRSKGLYDVPGRKAEKTSLVNVRVTTMDAELEFAIQPNTTGKQLFDQVVKTIGLREVWFFGLQYTDSKGYPTWLKLTKKVSPQHLSKNSRSYVDDAKSQRFPSWFRKHERFGFGEDLKRILGTEKKAASSLCTEVKKARVNVGTLRVGRLFVILNLGLAKVLSQDIKKESPLLFKFRAKFYPEDVAEEIIQDITLTVLPASEELYSLTALNNRRPLQPGQPQNAASAVHDANVRPSSMRPKRVVTGKRRAALILPAFKNIFINLRRVMDQHKLSRSEWENRITNWYKEHRGMMREEAMMEYLKIAQDLEMYGVNYFSIKNKKGTDLWLGVDALGLNIYEKDDKLTPKIGFPWSEIRNISFNDRKFVIKPIDKKAPDFIFFAPRLRINKRILALCMGNHELYMRRRKPDTIEVQQMKAQAREEKLQKQQERERLQREIQAREMAEKKQLEYEERLREMQKEISLRQKELAEAQETISRLESQMKDLQTAKQELELQQNELSEMMKRLEEAKNLEAAERWKLEEEIRLKQEEVMKIHEEVETKDQETRRLQQEVEEARRKQEEATAALISASSTPQHHHVEEADVHEGDDDMPNGGDVSRDLRNDDLAIHDPIEDRITLQEKNERLQNQLKKLKSDLEETRDEQKETQMDRLHKENVKMGRDKYKTLREIRKGNTKRRVDQFENL
ncbi:unnamed protein product [Notodromas monacha]|uniref:Moesin/ezrin/radixin homolog 1 n=2 Tax=Notodromas monacha TaxID=399045 RepID=A0A7R9GH03_9CRUS|nr:unnamed protein product [Notodromas monacha]CAG0922249.1 unnamed protein product [Notodromas monacha]